MSATTAALQATYDEFPYESIPFAETHPERLATLGHLFGLAPARVERCRVLELGCSSGGNLIPMAASFPGSEFIGIDSSAVQIERGVADIVALGLTNVRLLQMDLRDFGEAFGSFDYIIAHGLFSWVPSDVQEKLLDICAQQLAECGVAYVSYNTLPGWYMRNIVRDAMLYHARQFSDLKTRVQQARAMLSLLVESQKAGASGYAAMLREEAQRAQQHPDYYIGHDYLEEVNEPVYFHQFIEHAGRHGLRYLAEADFRSMLADDLPTQVQETLARIAPDQLHREQFMDFLRNRMFRRTLLVREGVPITRKLSPERVFALHIATRAQALHDIPDERSSVVEEFRSPEGDRLVANRPLTKAAMMALIERSPATIGFEELCGLAKARLGSAGPISTDDLGALASDLLKCFAAGVVEFHATALPYTIEPGAQAQASIVVRLQATRGVKVTNLRHEAVTLTEDQRQLVRLLDGTRTQEALAALLSPGEPSMMAMDKLRPALQQLAQQALLLR